MAPGIMDRLTTLSGVYPVVWSDHARQRFRERFYDCTDDTMDAHALRPAIRCALAAGAERVTLCGMTIVARKGRIVTIYPAGMVDTP